jgi:hypothetical protein
MARFKIHKKSLSDRCSEYFQKRMDFRMKAMNWNLLMILIALLQSLSVFGQDGYKKSGKDDPAADLKKETGIEDRAGGTHNAGNIGLFFENRGKLYPRRLTQGPSGEFPINSRMNYIYRINPMAGIPGNVVQGRYTSNEEWEAVGGYQNPAYTKIAFSDNPLTWNPDLGWPVQDGQGNAIIKSDQDSYCVYDDAKNGVQPLGLEIAQTGYCYGVGFAQNILFFKFELTNKGSNDLDNVYFALYCDLDVGDVSDGVAEYDDDFIGYDYEKSLLYFYDDGLSSEWAGGKTGQMGFTFLRTPEIDGMERGITSMHYNLYDDDLDRDSVQYAILSSDTSFIKPKSLMGKFFHPGITGNINFDDPSTIPATGLDILATISSGPYRLERGDTLAFYAAIVAGANHDNMLEAFDAAKNILDFDFEISKPPATPNLYAMSGDKRVTLYWDDVAEHSKDNFSGEYDFEGYRIYKSADKGLHWDQYDRNVDPGVGVDPVPIAQFDLINDLELDAGIQYSFVDTLVENGFEYWYSITSYDRGDLLTESLECGRGKTIDAINTVSVIPESRATDRVAVQSSAVQHTGKGVSNYLLEVKPVDEDSLKDNQYQIGFTYVTHTDRGRLKTQAIVTVYDSSMAGIRRYVFEFLSGSKFKLRDLITGEYVKDEPYSYRSGTEYPIREGSKKVIGIKLVDPDPSAADYLPKDGDYIRVEFGVYALNQQGDTLAAPRAMYIGKSQSIPGGVIFQMTEPPVIQSIIRQSGSDEFTITFEVESADEIVNNRYYLSVESKGIDANSNEQFISLTIRDSSGTERATFDSLYNADSFSFNGVNATVYFPTNKAPAPGNVFSIDTVVPAPPTLQDRYFFTIEGSTDKREELKPKLREIRVVPNPYVVGSLYEEEFGELRREPIRQLKFINLPGQCSIKIFSVAGDLLKTLHHDERHGTETWNLRSEGEREIAPGIYIYVVETGGEKYINRFAVIK